MKVPKVIATLNTIRTAHVNASATWPWRHH